MNIRFIIIIFLIVSLVIFSIILKNKKLKASVFLSLLYIIVVGLIIGLGGFVGNKKLLELSHQMIFYLLSGWTLIFGILHVILLKKVLPWPTGKNFWTEFFFTVIIGLVGGVFLLIVFQISDYSTFVGVNLTALLLFLVPYIFYGILRSYLNIPVKILRKWHFPVDQHVEDPLDREMESPLVIGFEFKKRSTDENMTSFRAKAPKEMVFGKLFYYFINDYNDRNPEEKIKYLNEKNKPVGWIFHFKPKWFSSIRYIDPEETNSFNFIRENSVIQCKRIIEN